MINDDLTIKKTSPACIEHNHKPETSLNYACRNIQDERKEGKKKNDRVTDAAR